MLSKYGPRVVMLTFLTLGIAVAGLDAVNSPAPDGVLTVIQWLKTYAIDWLDWVLLRLGFYLVGPLAITGSAFAWQHYCIKTTGEFTSRDSRIIVPWLSAATVILAGFNLIFRLPVPKVMHNFATHILGEGWLAIWYASWFLCTFEVGVIYIWVAFVEELWYRFLKNRASFMARQAAYEERGGRTRPRL